MRLQIVAGMASGLLCYELVLETGYAPVLPGAQDKTQSAQTHR